MSKLTLISERETYRFCLQAYLSSLPKMMVDHEGVDWLRGFSHLCLRPEQIRFFDLRDKDPQKRLQNNWGQPGAPLVFLLDSVECYTLPLPSDNPAVRMAL